MAALAYGIQILVWRGNLKNPPAKGMFFQTFPFSKRIFEKIRPATQKFIKSKREKDIFRQKNPENLGWFSGKSYSFTMVTVFILWGLRGLSDQLVETPAMRSRTSKPSVSLPNAA